MWGGSGTTEGGYHWNHQGPGGRYADGGPGGCGSQGNPSTKLVQEESWDLSGAGVEDFVKIQRLKTTIFYSSPQCSRESKCPDISF